MISSTANPRVKNVVLLQKKGKERITKFMEPVFLPLAQALYIEAVRLPSGQLLPTSMPLIAQWVALR